MQKLLYFHVKIKLKITSLKRSQITIKDIARELNISPSTVSRALKDHPDISPATKIAVNEVAQKLRYTPNAVALSLRMKKTNLIGVVIPQIVHFYFSSVISGIEEEAENAGYSVLVTQSGESYEREVKNVATCVASRVDGILISMAKNTHDYTHFENLLENNTPIVFFDRICPGLKVDRVVVDDYAGAYKAVEHMIKGGCRRIAHLSAPLHLLIARNRLNGYLDALRAYGIQPDDSLVIECDDRNKALERVPKLFAGENTPDGIFAINDLTASGAMSAVKKMGLRIPEDVAVCGFSDGIVAEVSDPAMTTVIQHGKEVGHSAARLLIDRIESEVDQKAFTTKMIKTTLNIRDTTHKEIM